MTPATDEQLLTVFKQGLEISQEVALRAVYDAGRLDGFDMAISQPVEQITINPVSARG